MAYLYRNVGVYSLNILPSTRRVILVNNNSFTTLLLASNNHLVQNILLFCFYRCIFFLLKSGMALLSQIS